MVAVTYQEQVDDLRKRLDQAYEARNDAATFVGMLDDVVDTRQSDSLGFHVSALGPQSLGRSEVAQHIQMLVDEHLRDIGSSVEASFVPGGELGEICTFDGYPLTGAVEPAEEGLCLYLRIGDAGMTEQSALVLPAYGFKAEVESRLRNLEEFLTGLPSAHSQAMGALEETTVECNRAGSALRELQAAARVRTAWFLDRAALLTVAANRRAPSSGTADSYTPERPSTPDVEL